MQSPSHDAVVLHALVKLKICLGKLSADAAQPGICFSKSFVWHMHMLYNAIK